MSNADVLIKKRLSEYKAKPLLPLELPKLLTKFRNTDSSVESFKSEYRRDPIFCYSLINAAWEATQTRTIHPFAADHAMSIIGIGTASRLVKFLKPEPKTSLSTEVKFCLTSSLLAAELANQIAKINSASNQVYWTALCYLLPETILWHVQPKNMWRIYYRQITIPKRMSLFEESKLGFNLHDWRVAVGEELHLSEQNQTLFGYKLPTNPKELFEYSQNGYSEKTPSLKEWHRNEGWLVVLANKLAKSILCPWSQSGYRHVFKLIQQLSGCDARKLTKAINESIRLVSIDLNNSQLPIPAVCHLLYKGRTEFPDWLVNPQVSPSKSLPKRPKPQSNLKVVLDKLANKAMTFDSSTVLVHFGLKTLIDELNFSRVSFLTVDYKTSTVVTRIALNAKSETKIRPDFDFKTPTPLTKFIDKQAFMLFSKSQHKKIWPKLPTNILKENIQEFILCSLKPGERIRAIIYADAEDLSVFSTQKISRVKSVLNAINTGLKSRNKAKKNQLGQTPQTG